MKRLLFLLVTAMFLAGCPSTVPPPATVPTPQGEDRYLIDPRSGWGTLSPDVDRKFESAWRFVLAGNETEARRRLAELQRNNPDLLPIVLAEAALDIRAGQLDAARAKVDRVKKTRDYLAARVYEAEIAVRENDTRRALTLYQDIAAEPAAPPTAAERVAQLRNTLFEQLFAQAQSAPDAQAISLLREALTFNPAAIEPRILLARKLLAQRSFDDARRELDPVLNTGEVDRNDVQELLAEIDVGRGRYQEAIARYDRLARRTRDPRHADRLEAIKEEFSMANMPAHYRAALESPAVTRADLAVLLYWTVPSIRFARNLGAPPIAVDLEDVAGREEMIRAIAIGLYDVDPVTRRVFPARHVSVERLSRHLVRLLTLRGAPCARGAVNALTACGVEDPAAKWPPDVTVTGRDVQRLLEQVAKQL